MSFSVVYGDILEQEVEAIVVPHLYRETRASELTARIYQAAGANMEAAYRYASQVAFKEKVESYHPLMFTEKNYPLASATPGFGLKAICAVHVNLHAEKWQNEQTDAECAAYTNKLLNCYYTALECAIDKLGVKSVALPLLGTSLLGVPPYVSRIAAERAAASYISKWRWRGNGGDTIKILIVIPNDLKTQALKAPEPAVRPRPRKSAAFDLDTPVFKRHAPVLPKLAAPAPKPTAPSENNDVFDEDTFIDDTFKDGAFIYHDVFEEFETRLSKKIKNSGKTKNEYHMDTCLDYLDCLNAPGKKSELAKMLNFNQSTLTKFLDAVKGYGGNIPRDKKRIIAIAIGIGLEDDDYGRFEFIRCSGFDYPSDLLDRQVEKIIRSGARNFRYINEKLCKINPDFDLTQPLRNNEPKSKSKSKSKSKTEKIK